jgi:hypothetical protein
MLCASARPGGQWSREPADIDLATMSKNTKEADALIVQFGFVAEERFNLMNGAIRRRYVDEDGSHVDVFVDELRLCHVVSWRRSLRAGTATLPVVPLLLTKLQIVSLEDKDRTDLAALLTDAWEELNQRWPDLESQVRDDWGLWRTSRGSLEAMAQSSDPVVAERADEALRRWQAMNLSPRARLRALVGERVRWYEEPEEV